MHDSSRISVDNKWAPKNDPRIQPQHRILNCTAILGFKRTKSTGQAEQACRLLDQNCQECGGGRIPANLERQKLAANSFARSNFATQAMNLGRLKSKIATVNQPQVDWRNTA